jgi:hypothetical protein
MCAQSLEVTEHTRPVAIFRGSSYLCYLGGQLCSPCFQSKQAWREFDDFACSFSLDILTAIIE